MKALKSQVLLLLFLAGTFSLPCTADQWAGDGNIGYNSVNGNSKSISLSLGLAGTYESDDWLHSAEAETYRARSNSEKDRSYAIKLQTDHEMDESTFAFGHFRYLDDRNSGYDYQASLSLGAGRTFLNNGNNKLNGQIGFGYRTSEPNSLSQELEKEPVGTAKITYDKDLTESTVLKTKWSAETGADNTYLEGNIALLVSMTDALGLKLSYIAKHNTDVPTGTRNTDRFTNFSLNYKFN